MFEYPVVDISETESKAFSEIAAPKNASAKKSSKPKLIKRVQFARTVEVFKISPVKLADVSDDHHAFCFAQLESDSDESVSNDEEFADCPSPVIPGKSSPVTPKVDASVNEIVQGRIKVRLFSENGEYEGEQDNPCISSPQSLNQMDPEDGFVSFSQLSLLFDETFNSQPKSFTNVCNETSEKVVCHSEYLRGNEDNAQQSELNESQLPAPELEEVEPGHRSGEDTPDVEVSERPAVDSVHSRRLELCVADDDVDNGSTKIDKIESFEINEVGIDEGTNSPTIDNEKCQFLCLHSIAADESKESYEKNVKLLQDLEESESDSHKLLPPVESEKPAFVGFRTAAGKTVSYSKESEEKSRKFLQDLDETESDSHKLLPSVESEKPAFVGFRTAAGKTVSYSNESEEKSRKLLQDLDETESDSHKLLPPVESEKPAFVGFRTAAGKTVSYSKESEEKSRKLLQDLDETESDSHKLLPPVESEKPAFVGFRTAAGKTVSYSKESEEKSRKFLQDLDETESDSLKLLLPVESEKPAFVGFRTAAGKTVSYSKESEEKSRKLLQVLDETESDNLKLLLPVESEKPAFVGFRTAAGKTVSYSKESEEKSRKFLQDLDETESDSHKLLPPVESEKPAFVGFRTAAGKTVSYSKESEEKSRKLLQVLDETESDNLKLLLPVESEKPAFVGFRTAAGKTVSYSKESEEKSRKLLQDLDETESDSLKLLLPVESEKPAFVGFRTAAGKTVSYSKESEEKSRKLLQDLDETESDSHKLLPPVESEKPAFVSFRTAAGKTVSYSKESEEKSRKLLQDLDETESEQNSKCSSRGESKKRVLAVSCAEDTLERRAVKQDSKESIENELVGLPKLTDHDSIGLKTPLVVEPPFSVRGKLIAGMTPENLKNINSVPFEPKPCVHTPFPSKNSHPPNKELFFNDEAKPSTVISSFGTASSNTSQPAYQLRSRSKSSKTFQKPRCLFEIDEKDSITSKKDENSTSVAEKGSAAKNAKTSCESNTSKSVAGKRGSTSKFKSPVIADKLVHGTHLKINLKESTNSTESTAISNKMGRILNIRTQCLMKLAFEDLAVINDHRTSNARMSCTKVYCIAKNVVSGYNFTFGVDEFFSPKAVSTGIVYIGDNAELNIKGKKTIGPLDFHRAMLTIPGELLSWNQKQIRNT